MKILVILAHPEPASFNHAIAKTVIEYLETSGYSICFHDLYAEKFDPLLAANEISKNCQLPEGIAQHGVDLATADGIVIVHPNWWGQPPAILKGWIDRVIRPGIAYEFKPGDSGEGVPIGLLRARTAVVFNTANTSAKREKEIFGDPLEMLWKKCILEFCGIQTFYRKMFRIVVTSNLVERRAWLDEVKTTLQRYFPG